MIPSSGERYGMTEIHNPADNLLAGESPRPERSVVVIGTEGGLPRGAILGRITIGDPVVVPTIGNTGNGEAGAVVLGQRAVLGVYSLACIEAAVGGGVFSVYSPEGYRMPDLTVEQEYVSEHFTVTIVAGLVDFILGDTIAIAIPPGSEKYCIHDPGATDGSQIPRAILGRPIAATPEDTKAFAYVGGEFNSSALVGFIDPTVIEQLADRGIFVKMQFPEIPPH